MLMICHHAELGPNGIKAWALDPGYVLTNLSGTGEKGREQRVANSAGGARESAKGIVALVYWRRDSPVWRSVNKDGFIPW
jgi:NAD(P)-dependent dehydrogenase (short-subunit alcohol dehydrogenase family)